MNIQYILYKKSSKYVYSTSVIPKLWLGFYWRSINMEVNWNSKCCYTIVQKNYSFTFFIKKKLSPSFNLTTVKTVQLGKSVYRHPAY